MKSLTTFEQPRTLLNSARQGAISIHANTAHRSGDLQNWSSQCNRLICALSAPIAELKPDVIEAYKRLESQWKELNTVLTSLTIPCTISAMFTDLSDPRDPNGMDHIALEWRKHKGAKRICLTTYRYDGRQMDVEEIVTPIEEWSNDQKLNALRVVPKLFENVPKQIERYIERTKPATDGDCA